jgi:hypothetical protein
MGTARLLAIGLAALCLCACATTPRVSHEDLTKRISGDAAAFNVAYAKAVNAQILLNVLRARDRQPRYYLSMSGITDTASYLYGDSIGIGSVAVGEQRGQPFGIGSLSARRETSSRPTYSVSPLDAKTLKAAVFQPTQASAFAHYWGSGWPRDLLLLLMVERMTVTRDGKVSAYINEANDLIASCPETATESRGCAFYRAVGAFLSGVGEASDAPTPGAQARGVCGLMAAYGETSMRAAPSPKDQECSPAIALNGAVYRFELRSFDDIVYYVGELMRPSYTVSEGKPAAPMEALINVRTAGLRGAGATAPLFRIVPADAAGANPSYAAEVSYEGRVYYAGPPIGRSCYDPSPEGLCTDDAAHGDRSSSVLSLLAELLALNQSPESIRAPARLFAD